MTTTDTLEILRGASVPCEDNRMKKTTAARIESLTKATQCADLLAADILEAHKAACRDNPLLVILLRDLIRDSAEIKNRLAEIEACLLPEAAS